MNRFQVEHIEALQLKCTEPLSAMYTLSPFVWRDEHRDSLLLRAVPHAENPADKIARIYYGVSEDGLNFVMDDEPTLTPGPGADDKDGCEDPTLIRTNDQSFVYYSGWNETKKQGKLLLASGTDCRHLQKSQKELLVSNHHTNPKEATVVSVPDGTWRLFFEYADAKASKIGIASAPQVDGPWTIQTPLFEARPNQWDNWHLSTGPILDSDPQCPIMFYNGATRDAHWRIGWIAFDAEYTRIIARSDAPLIVPPSGEPGDTDIAFAASCVMTDDGISLYYTVADKTLFRATLRQEKH